MGRVAAATRLTEAKRLYIHPDDIWPDDVWLDVIWLGENLGGDRLVATAMTTLSCG